MLLKRKPLSDAKIVSVTKKEYGFSTFFVNIQIKSLKSISDEWLNAISWGSCLSGIFI